MVYNETFQLFISIFESTVKRNSVIDYDYGLQIQNKQFYLTRDSIGTLNSQGTESINLVVRQTEWYNLRNLKNR